LSVTAVSLVCDVCLLNFSAMFLIILRNFGRSVPGDVMLIERYSIRAFFVLTFLLSCLTMIMTACTGGEIDPESAEVGTASMPDAELTLTPALKAAPSATAVSADMSEAVASGDPARTTDKAQATVMPVEASGSSTAAGPADSEQVPAESDTQTTVEEAITNTPAPSAPEAAETAASPTAAEDSTAAPAPTASPLPQNSETPLPAGESSPTAATVAATLATATSQPAAEASATTDPTAGTAGHFADCVTRTGSSAAIAVLNDTPISGGLVLAPGDEIAIFTPDGALCAGVTSWTGENTAIAAWGDDSQTDAVDGLSDGEIMQFRIWDDSEAVEYILADVTYSSGDGVYFTDSIHVVDAMSIE
jgi:hypothetical protein